MKWSLPFDELMRARDVRLSSAVPKSIRPDCALGGSHMSSNGVAARHLSESDADTGLAALAYLEIIVLGALIPAGLLWFSHTQYIQFVLPLLVLSPLLLGLHYGFFPGAGGALATTVALAVITYFKPDLLGEFPKTQAISLLLVGMVCGEARDIWTARLGRLQYLCNYHQNRLEQFTSTYRILQISHSQLERRVAGSTNNLRTALERLELRDPDSYVTHSEQLDGIGDWLLDIMVEAGNLHTAAVYGMNGRGILRMPPIAIVGKAKELSRFNPLLREALMTGSLTSVRASNQAIHESVIAVVPLIDATGHIHGIVSINEMPFLSIHQDTFEVLSVLGRHIGDILARRTRPMGDTQGPFTLRQSLQRNLIDANKHAIPAALVACKIVDATRRDLLITHCCHNSRGLDQSWITINRKGQTVILKLLPLTDEIGVNSYLTRLEYGQVGGSSAINGIVTYLWMLDKDRTADEILKEVYVACEIEAVEATPRNNQHSISEVAL